MTQKNLNINTPRWAVSLLTSCRYKGAKGGRSSGKSHFFAENLIEEHIQFPWLQSVCVREIQRSLKYSAKKLLEQKIRKMRAADYFTITDKEIRRNGGDGVIIFEGMQDHTADSIKSLEGFHRAWVEEAQNLSARSLELLLPTIREPGSEIWFSWNPDDERDPVELHFAKCEAAECSLVHVNYQDNPWCPEEMVTLADWQKRVDYEKYVHIWLGGFNTKSRSQVLSGKWRVDEFVPGISWNGPYFGADWGFSTDPTALIKFFVNDNKLYIHQEKYGYGVETVDTPALFDGVPDAAKHTIRADSARPEMVSHLQKHGYPKIASVSKWPGSVEDGVSWLRGFDEIIIHPDCPEIAEEARLWSYKVDKKTMDVLPVLVDKHNHGWDAVRYGGAPMIKRGLGGVVTAEQKGVNPKATYKYLNGQWVVDKEGALRVWEEPGRQYIVGAVMQQTGAGISSIQVVDHFLGQQAACWEGTVAPDEFAVMIASICHRYANAWAVLDLSGQGPVVLTRLRKLHRRVYSEIPPEAKTGGAPKTRRFGFDGNRHMARLVEQLAAESESNLSGIQDQTTLDELNSFTRTHDNKIEVIPGCSHERILAYCLARHGYTTLPKPSRQPHNQKPTAITESSSDGWAGHV